MLNYKKNGFLSYVALAFIAIAMSCGEQEESNTLDSARYPSKVERITVLKNEIVVKSDIQDAEFHLFNVNGFSNSRTVLPGASSWNYTFAIKVDTQDVDKWLAGMTPVKSLDSNTDWARELVKAKSTGWVTNGSPEIYIREGYEVQLIVYRNEGIIFKRIVQH